MSSNLFICHWNIFDWKIFEIAFMAFTSSKLLCEWCPLLSIITMVKSYLGFDIILTQYQGHLSCLYMVARTNTDPTFWRNCSFMILNEILRRIIHCCRIRQSNNNFYVVPPSIQQVDTENQERDSRHHPLLDRDNDVRLLISTFSVWILLCILSIPKIIFVLWPLDTNLQNLLCGI